MTCQKQILGKIESVTDLTEPKGAVEVRGIAGIEETDQAGEKLAYEKSKAKFAKWSKAAQARTGGKSYGNVRSQHNSKIAAGLLTEPIINDDANKCFRVVAKIVDPLEAEKCRAGIYGSFSPGGDYDETWLDKTETFKGKPVRWYTPEIAELSICDSGCMPSANFDSVKGHIGEFIYIKLDGTKELRKFAESPADAILAKLDEYAQAVRDEFSKALSQPRSSDSTFSTGKDAEGNLVTADHHRGAAVQARKDGDEPKAKTLEAQAASLDAQAVNTQEAHRKAATAHRAAATANLAAGNETTAMGHDASANGHDLSADALQVASTDAADKAAADTSLGKQAPSEANRSVIEALTGYLKQENISVTDEELTKLAERIAELAKAKPKALKCDSCGSDDTGMDGDTAKCNKCGNTWKCDKAAPAGDLQKKIKYLVTEQDGTTHLPYTDSDGKPDHNHMGAAWAALTGGYRGNKYEGPDKAKAKAKLKSLYESEAMETPSEKAMGGFESLVKFRYGRALIKRECAMPLAKSLYDVGTLASMLESLAWMQTSLDMERKMEGDNSPQPDKLRSIIQTLISFFQDLAKEESDELSREETAKAAQAALLTKAAGSSEQTGGSAMTTEQTVVSRLQKATPEALARFVSALAKRAKAMDKCQKCLDKAIEHHGKMGEHLDKMSDCIDTMKDHLGGDAKKALEASGLEKSVSDAAEGIASIHKDLVTQHDLIGEDHDLISGAIEEAAAEADEEVEEGITASERGGEKAAVARMQKRHDQEIARMRKENERNMAKMMKTIEASNKQTQELVNGFAKAVEKAGKPTVVPGAQPHRNGAPMDKAADATNGLHKVEVLLNPAVANDPTLSAPGSTPGTISISPVLADGVTPNPQFTKLAAAGGDAFVKSSISDPVPAETGNPFAGAMGELVSKRA